VILKEGLGPCSGDINRLKMMNKTIEKKIKVISFDTFHIYTHTSQFIPEGIENDYDIGN
jgi:hypothetical protein